MIIKQINKHRFENVSFKDVNKTEKNSEILDYLKDYAKNISNKIENFENIILCGNVGTGKTMMAYALKNELEKISIEYESDFNFETQRFEKTRQRKFEVVICKYSEMIRKIRINFTKRKTDEFTIDYFSLYRNADFLIVDEIGIQYDTPAERKDFYEICDYRYENYKPIMLISNHKILDCKNKSIEDFLGKRVFDRLISKPSKYFYLNEKSYRRN